MIALLLAACAHPAPGPALPFAWEARAIEGEVRVLPGLPAHAGIPLHDDSFVGSPLPEPRVAVRRERWQQLHQLPETVGWALPGAVNGALHTDWQGTFHSASWPRGARERLLHALQQGHDPDRSLARVARSVGGDAVLVSWIDRIDARPVSLDGFPGDRIDTPAGSVIVDHADEPYLVDLRVGMALVARDGEVVLRYQQDMVRILSATHPPEAVARSLAADMAREVVKVWHHPEPAAARAATHPSGHAAP